MNVPAITLETWRALVERDLAGRAFDAALVHTTLEGLQVAPLYTEAPALPRVLGDGAPFRICMRHEAGSTASSVQEDLDGGADALWLPRPAAGALPPRLPADVLLVIDDGDAACTLGGERTGLVTTLALHAQGADACDEVAAALSLAVARLDAGAGALLVRVAAGRDTFVELCKLRALRLCLRKVLHARGGTPPSLRLHAVASSRTLAARDPWVNLLRGTTQLFAAILGGADLVTPRPFDAALATSSAQARRIARNAAHVLREEGALGRVVDPAAGSYFLDTLTDALARAAWTRFQALEGAGGLGGERARTLLEARVAATRRARSEQLAKRKMPVLGVSEFAHLGESLPSRPRPLEGADLLRDDAAFEALRERAERLPADRRVVTLATLGPAGEAQARVGFASSLFAVAGLATRELASGEALSPGAVACLCGTDERYATDAVEQARRLRAGGARYVLLAGRPGALEAALRAAGVEAFVFLGCDAPAVLAKVLEALG